MIHNPVCFQTLTCISWWDLQAVWSAPGIQPAASGQVRSASRVSLETLQIADLQHSTEIHNQLHITPEVMIKLILA